jgi:hypothetical protein
MPVRDDDRPGHEGAVSDNFRGVPPDESGPAGASPERREYEEPRREFVAEGRHPNREAEAAARVVNPQRSDFGGTRAAREKERRGESSDRELPIQGYKHLTIPQIVDRIPSLSPDELREIREYERAHRRRKTLLVRLERQLRDRGGDTPREAGGAEGPPGSPSGEPRA